MNPPDYKYKKSWQKYLRIRVSLLMKKFVKLLQKKKKLVYKILNNAEEIGGITYLRCKVFEYEFVEVLRGNGGDNETHLYMGIE